MIKPKKTAKTTPKDFFLWAGAMIAFYWAVLSTLFLIFNYIDYAFPNALAYYPGNPYDSAIPYLMASIIVMLPFYIGLSSLIRRDAVRDSSRSEIWVRRWALILTLFVAGIAIAADLITLLTSFLGGEELTTAFLLKVLLVFLFAAGVFMHFIADLKGYWSKFPSRRGYVGIGVIVLALATIASGFLIVGTPQQARQARFDDQRVQNLQIIQYRVIDYWNFKRVLPATLAEVNDPLNDAPLPLYDGQTGAPYTYAVTGKLSFKLCAVFNAAGGYDQYVDAREAMPVKAGDVDNWQHGSGEQCFERTIDPGRFEKR